MFVLILSSTDMNNLTLYSLSTEKVSLKKPWTEEDMILGFYAVTQHIDCVIYNKQLNRINQ
jgi:hypothetical protein